MVMYETSFFNNGVKGMGVGMGICRDAATYALVGGGGGGGGGGENSLANK